MVKIILAAIFYIALGFAAYYGFLYLVKLYLEYRGMTVTSWWRTEEHNAEVGGAKLSKHLFGLAYDVVPATQENLEILKGLGMFTIVYNDHLHGDFR